MEQQPQQAPKDDSAQLMQAMQGVGNFLGQLLQNMGPSLPPEVQKAIPVVQQFLIEGPSAQPAQQDPNVAGGKQVVPADQPMNPKAVPAR